MTSFFAQGRPKPQGSKVEFTNAHTGRAQMRESSGKGKWTVFDWRDRVRREAQLKWPGAPINTPVRVRLWFLFSRPKSHYRTGRNSHLYSRNATAYPATRSLGDVDKLTRAVLDALTGVVYEDDVQVVDVHATRSWCDSAAHEGVRVNIEPYSQEMSSPGPGVAVAQHTKEITSE